MDRPAGLSERKDEAMNTMQGPMQGPPVKRDEAAIKRRIAEACGVADDVLRVLHHAIYTHAHGTDEQRIDGSEDHLLREIGRARGELAEWRPESD